MLAVFFGLNNTVLATDFGKQGNNFPVKEEGFIAMIQRKLKSLDINAHQEQMRTHAKKAVEEPQRVAGIARATKTTSHSYDPSYTITQDVVLPCGKLLYVVGETINPLGSMSWDGKLLFIDGRDKEQVQWVQEQTADRNKIVLVAGRPLELEEELQQPVYFDQAGELTTKFNIVHVPTIVEQEGKYLKITEINIKE